METDGGVDHMHALCSSDCHGGMLRRTTAKLPPAKLRDAKLRSHPNKLLFPSPHIHTCAEM